MAISRLTSCVYLGSALRLRLHRRQLWDFVTTATSPPRTNGVSPLPGLLQLDRMPTPMEPCWISVVVHSPVPHRSEGGHFVSLSDIFADMFHLETDVNATEVQMEI